MEVASVQDEVVSLNNQFQEVQQQNASMSAIVGSFTGFANCNPQKLLERLRSVATNVAAAPKLSGMRTRAGGVNLTSPVSSWASGRGFTTLH